MARCVFEGKARDAWEGRDVRLSEKMDVRKLGTNNGLLSLEHVLEQMLEVHRRFVNDGEIQSGPSS